MKGTGMLCRVDSMGRVVLPKSLREAKGLMGEHTLDIKCRDGYIIVNEVMDRCIFCGKQKNLLEFKGKLLCEECREDAAKKK